MRVYKKQAKKEKPMIDKSFMKFNVVSLMLLLLSLFIELYLINKYYGREAYVPFSISLFLQGTGALIGMILLNIANKEPFFDKEFPFQTSKQGGYYLAGIFSLFILQMIIQAVAQTVFRLAMEPIDIYFYYLAAAVIEEALYRMFLISLIVFVFSKVNAKIPEFVVIFIAMIISSFVFMTVHFSAYGDRPDLLMAMFFVGVLLSIYYLIFKDITVPMLGHLLINLLATWVMLGTINIVV
jgi:hypothetical protein